MANPIKASDIIINDGAIRDIIAEIKQLEEANKSLKSSVDTVAVSVSKRNVATAEGRAAVTEEAKLAEKLARQYKLNSLAISENGVELIKLRAEKARNLRIQKLQIKANDSTLTSYDRTSAKYSLNKIALNRMSDAMIKNTAEGRKLERQTSRLYESMNAYQKRMGKHTLEVGNYSNATKGLISNLKGLAAVYLSFTGIQRLGRIIFEDTKAIDGLNLAYKQIIPDSQKLAQVNEFLSKTSKAYGTNILNLRKAYLRFTAASKSSTLSQEEQQKVFNSVSKAAATLGLEGAKVDRVFNALEQIMSKGKVSSEELRQQLGDSLPGSLQIMADALGVSTAKLDDMLKKGEVMSDVAIPKFAAQLEKAYGIESVERVDNLAAAQGRFETAVVNTIGKLQAADSFKDFFNLMAEGVTWIGDNVKILLQLGKAIALTGAVYVTWNATLAISNALAATQVTRIAAIIFSQRGLRFATLLSARAMRAFTAAMASNPFGLFVVAATAAVTLLIKYNKEIDNAIGGQTALEGAVRNARREIAKEQIEANNLFEAVKDVNASNEDRIESLKKLKELYPKHLESLNTENVTTASLALAQRKVNDEIERNILLQAKKDRLIEITNKKVNAQIKLAELNRGGVGSVGGEAGVSAESVFAVRIAEQNAIIKEATDQKKELDKLFDDLLSPPGSANRGTGALGNLGRVVGGGTEGGAGSKTQKELFTIQQLRIDAMVDGFDKEIAQLELDQAKRESIFKKNGLSINLLVAKNLEERQEIIDKYGFGKRGVESEPLDLLGQLGRVGDNPDRGFLKRGGEDDSMPKYVKDKIGKIKAVVAKEVEEDTGGGFSIYDLFGLDPDDPQDQKATAALANAFGQATSYLNEWLSQRVKAADAVLAAADKEVEAAEKALQGQLEAKRQGEAYDMAQAQRELKNAKANRKKALDDKKKAQKEELAIQTAMQAANLATAVTNVLRDVPFPFNLAATGVLIGGFVAAKAKAFQAVNKQEFAEGGFEIVGGGRHGSGNDTFIGMTNDGKRGYAEQGEAKMILNRSATRKAGTPLLKEVFGALNTGSFDERFVRKSNLLGNSTNVNIDTSRMEGYLYQIANKKDSESPQFYTDGNGNTIKQIGNRRYRYVNN